MGFKESLAKARHNAGEAFLHLLDDVRQRVVEEGWFGQTLTPAHQGEHKFSDPAAALSASGRALYDAHQARAADTHAWLHQTGRYDPETGFRAEYDTILQDCAAKGVNVAVSPHAKRFVDLHQSLYGSADNLPGKEITDLYRSLYGKEPPGRGLGDDEGMSL